MKNNCTPCALRDGVGLVESWRRTVLGKACSAAGEAMCILWRLCAGGVHVHIGGGAPFLGEACRAWEAP